MYSQNGRRLIFVLQLMKYHNLDKIGIKVWQNSLYGVFFRVGGKVVDYFIAFEHIFLTYGVLQFKYIVILMVILQLL